MKLRAKLTELKSDMGRVTMTFETGADPADIEKYKDVDVDLEVKKHREHRSLNANRCLWACITDLAGKIGVTNWDMYLMELDSYGQSVNVRVREDALPELKAHWRETMITGEEKVKETVKDEVSGYPVEIEVTYYYVNCYYGSHEYNTAEFARLLDGVIKDMKAQGLDTPPSEDMQRMLRDMEEKERKDNNARL